MERSWVSSSLSQKSLLIPKALFVNVSRVMHAAYVQGQRQHLRHNICRPAKDAIELKVPGTFNSRESPTLQELPSKVSSGFLIILEGQRYLLIILLTIIPWKSGCLAITIRPKILGELFRQATHGQEILKQGVLQMKTSYRPMFEFNDLCPYLLMVQHHQRQIRRLGAGLDFLDAELMALPSRRFVLPTRG